MERLDLAERAIRFINRLTLVGDFAGESFTLRPWQEDILRRGFKTSPEGRLVHRTWFISTPQGNAKTTLIAAVVLFSLLGTGKQQQEIVSAAGSRGQAKIVFNACASMIRADPHLNRLCKILDTKNQIICKANGNKYESLSSQAGTKHGLSPSVCILDEIAIIGSELWEVLQAKTRKRRDGLFILTGTAGNDKRKGKCYAEWEYARKVKRGEVNDPKYLAVIYEMDEGDDWEDPKTWHKVNPALGDWLTVENFELSYNRAKEIPTDRLAFLQMFLNEWVSNRTTFLPEEVWSKCRYDFDPAKFKGKNVTAGLDLSSTQDISALVLTVEEDGYIYCMPHFWMPEATAAQKEKSDHGAHYRQWAKEGLITLTPGEVVDFEAIKSKIIQLNSEYFVEKLLADPWNATYLLTQLRDAGVNVEFIRQGFTSLTSPTKELQRLTLLKKLRHNNKVLDWMASNAIVAIDSAGNIKLCKEKSGGTGRIDGLSALVNALAGRSAESAPTVLWMG